MNSHNNKTEEKSVILDNEKELVLDHNYDGIQELDHPLPSWWTATFIGTVVFGVFYTIFYMWAGGLSLEQEFVRDMKMIEEAKAKLAKDVDNFDIDAYQGFTAADGVKKGLAVYQENCMECHKEGGAGDIGPNLTDDYWLLAKGTPETIYSIVNKGNEDNGMPAWGEIITKDEMYAVTAYLMTLKGTNIAGGKEPQGEKVP